MSEASVSRRYVDSRFGQSHVHLAEPEATGNHPALVCMHMGPWAGVSFLPLLKVMGKDRTAVAVDTPGYGNSDAPREQPSVADYAASMGDVIDGLGLNTVDVMGERTGAKVALELARQRPGQVRRVILVSPVIWTDTERVAREAYPPEKVYKDGTHLKSYWQISVGLSMQGRTLEMIGQTFYSRLLQNKIAHWGRRAAASYNARRTLKELNKPVMVLRPNDELWAFAPRVQPLLKHPESKIVDLPDWAFGFMDLKAPETAQLVREFVDRGGPQNRIRSVS